MDPNGPQHHEAQPSTIRWALAFLFVGAAWGLTTPFMRRAAVGYTPVDHASVSDPKRSWLGRLILKAFWAVVDMLRRPAYAIPFLCNITGSVWFFILVGQAGESHATS